MASRGKKGSKKSLNNSQTSSNKKTILIIGVAACGIAFLAILCIILFPDITTTRTAKILAAVIIGLVSAGATISGIVAKVKKKVLNKYAIPVIALSAAFVVFSIAQGVSGVVETEIDKPGLPPGIAVEDEKEEIFTFNINFDDALFSDCSSAELSEYKDTLRAQIIQALKAEYNGSTAYSNELRQQYDEFVLEAHDFEKAYKLMYDNGVFTNHHQSERIEFLDDAIKLREDGNQVLEIYDNQKCIGLLYNDKGYELCKVEKHKEAIIVYETAVKWYLKALNLLFNSNRGDKAGKEKILSNLIRSYEGIKESTTEDNGDYKKSVILIEIYEEIRDCDLI